jgi:hypothetical protein
MLNILFQSQVILVIIGDFNVNFMTDNTKKFTIISPLEIYNLDFIVDYPTCINR